VEEFHGVKGSVVEYFHDRLRDEIERLNVSMEGAAREIGEASGQGLRDVVNGRKRLTVEMLAKLMRVGVDAHFVLTGVRNVQPGMIQTQTLGDPGGKHGDLCRRLDGLSARQVQVIRDLLDAFTDR